VKKPVNFLVQTAVLLSAALLLTSCLTTEVDIDLRTHNDLRLTLVYRMPLSLWQFGVFDEDSQERAIPVSRRDAEETAILHPQVTLETYSLDESGDDAVITVVYRAASTEGLQALWGEVAGEPMDLSLDGRRLVLPLTEGLGETTADPQQQELIGQVFLDRHFRVTVHTPDETKEAVYPDIPAGEILPVSGEATVSWEAPMAEILTARAGQNIAVEW
jgi:hypothetical protein